MNISIITTSRGSKNLFVNGFQFSRKRSINGKEYWSCKTCKCSCVTEGEELVKDPGEHNDFCLPCAPKQQAEELKSQMRQRAREEPNSSIKRIYDDASAAVANNEALGAHFPGFESVQTSLYRARRKNQPALPRNLNDLELPEMYRSTTDGRRFLLVDSGPGNDRILVFATDESLNVLSRIRKIWADGTFKSVPDLFLQLFTIHAMPIDGFMVPLLHCLLPDKHQRTYERLIDLIREQMGQRNLPLQIDRFSCDFERGLRNAFTGRFPGCRLEGCFFHLSQCLYRQVQQLGLTRAYQANDGENTVRTYVRKHAALALLPLDEVEPTLRLIQNERAGQNFDDDILEKLNQFDVYFHNQWIVNMEPRTWNHWENLGPRTNNHLEGYHHKINKTFTSNHPNIFRLISVLQQHEIQFRAKIEMANTGNIPRRKNAKYAEVDRRLTNLKMMYINGLRNAFELCSALAHYTGI